jgi:hypothetical protein
MSNPGSGAALLSDEIVELMGSGVDVYVATRDASMLPESMLAMGLEPLPSRSEVTVYLPANLAEATLKNLEANGAIAITVSRASDLRTLQLKGKCKQVRPSTDADREKQLIFRAALTEQLAFVGVPRSATRRLVWWPSIAVEVEISDIFVQTPGPRAGERWSSPAV